jgi:hypothetical protein
MSGRVWNRLNPSSLFSLPLFEASSSCIFWQTLAMAQQQAARLASRMQRELKMLASDPPPGVCAWPLHSHLLTRLQARKISLLLQKITPFWWNSTCECILCLLDISDPETNPYGSVRDRLLPSRKCFLHLVYFQKLNIDWDLSCNLHLLCKPVSVRLFSSGHSVTGVFSLAWRFFWILCISFRNSRATGYRLCWRHF